jgi:hypothetical protein
VSPMSSMAVPPLAPAGGRVARSAAAPVRAAR